MAGVEVNAASPAVAPARRRQAREPANCNCPKTFRFRGHPEPPGPAALGVPGSFKTVEMVEVDAISQMIIVKTTRILLP